MAHTEKVEEAQAPTPDPALKRLNKLVGAWDMTGHTLDSPVDNISGWNKFEWLPGGFFLQSSGEIDFRGFKVNSLELIGYDPATHAFASRVYSNMSGDVLPYYWDVQGNTVTHWADDAKFTGTLSPDGKTLTGGWRPNAGKEEPDTEGASNVSYDVVMTRIK